MKQAIEWINEVGEACAKAMFAGSKPPGVEVEKVVEAIQKDALTASQSRVTEAEKERYEARLGMSYLQQQVDSLRLRDADAILETQPDGTVKLKECAQVIRVSKPFVEKMVETHNENVTLRSDLQREKGMLDWLDKSLSEEEAERLFGKGNTAPNGTLRSAITAAMEGGKG